MSYTKQTVAGGAISAVVDFGYPNGGEGMSVTETIEDTFVTALSRFVFKFSDSDDHNIEEAVLEEIRPLVLGIVPGVSFDLMTYAPNDTWGRYNLTILVLH